MAFIYIQEEIPDSIQLLHLRDSYISSQCFGTTGRYGNIVLQCGYQHGITTILIDGSIQVIGRMTIRQIRLPIILNSPCKSDLITRCYCVTRHGELRNHQVRLYKTYAVRTDNVVILPNFRFIHLVLRIHLHIDIVFAGWNIARIHRLRNGVIVSFTIHFFCFRMVTLRSPRYYLVEMDTMITGFQQNSSIV